MILHSSNSIINIFEKYNLFNVSFKHSSTVDIFSHYIQSRDITTLNNIDKIDISYVIYLILKLNDGLFKLSIKDIQYIYYCVPFNFLGTEDIYNKIFKLIDVIDFFKLIDCHNLKNNADLVIRNKIKFVLDNKYKYSYNIENSYFDEQINKNIEQLITTHHVFSIQKNIENCSHITNIIIGFINDKRLYYSFEYNKKMISHIYYIIQQFSIVENNIVLYDKSLALILANIHEDNMKKNIYKKLTIIDVLKKNLSNYNSIFHNFYEKYQLNKLNNVQKSIKTKKKI